MHPRQIMDSIEYSPVTLTRGVTSDTSFNQWATGLFDLVENQAGVNINEGSSDPNPSFLDTVGNIVNSVQSVIGPRPVGSFNPKSQYRKDIVIKHINKSGQTVVEYNLFGAWPIGYKPASNFNANDDEGFSMESITLAYDGFDVRYASIAGAGASLGLTFL